MKKVSMLLATLLLIGAGTSVGQARTCKSFPVKKTGAQWGGTVIWQRNFPIRGPRRYKVSWLQGTHRLGPVLAFNLPAP